MENVIQKYLRNEFETIEEYNAHAGEVAEPFRVLVVANFPANFNETAARRLVEHRQQRGPLRRLHPDRARHQAASCPPASSSRTWSRTASTSPGRTAGSPGATRTSAGSRWRSTRRPTRDVRRRSCTTSASRPRDANRVEVPFEFIAPPPDDCWTCDSRDGRRRPARPGRRHQASVR